MDDQVNRKLFLLDEVYGVFPYEKILETVIYFESMVEEIDEFLVALKRVEDMLRAVNEDTLEAGEHIRILEIQRTYLIENLNTFRDALSLHEEDLVKKVYFPDTDSWGEVSSN